MAKKHTVKEETIVTPKKEKIVPIKWNIPDSIISRFATNVVVQIVEHEFRIMFFELKRDIRLNPNDPLPDEVKADCVASIIMSPEKFAEITPLFERQLAIFHDKKIRKESSMTASEPAQLS